MSNAIASMLENIRASARRLTAAPAPVQPPAPTVAAEEETAASEAARPTKLGYDGITHMAGEGQREGGGKGEGEGDKRHRVWIAFEPNQVKSTANEGSWDSNDPRMHKEHGGEVPSVPRRPKAGVMDDGPPLARRAAEASAEPMPAPTPTPSVPRRPAPVVQQLKRAWDMTSTAGSIGSALVNVPGLDMGQIGAGLLSALLAINQGGGSMPRPPAGGFFTQEMDVKAPAMQAAEGYGRLRRREYEHPEGSMPRRPAIRREGGGEVPEVPGIPRQADEVPIKAQAGEVVVKNGPAQAYRTQLDQMNAGLPPHFDQGGEVPSMPRKATPPGAGQETPPQPSTPRRPVSDSERRYAAMLHEAEEKAADYERRGVPTEAAWYRRQAQLHQESLDYVRGLPVAELAPPLPVAEFAPPLPAEGGAGPSEPRKATPVPAAESQPRKGAAASTSDASEPAEPAAPTKVQSDTTVEPIPMADPVREAIPVPEASPPAVPAAAASKAGRSSLDGLAGAANAMRRLAGTIGPSLPTRGSSWKGFEDLHQVLYGKPPPRDSMPEPQSETVNTAIDGLLRLGKLSDGVSDQKPSAGGGGRRGGDGGGGGGGFSSMMDGFGGGPGGLGGAREHHNVEHDDEESMHKELIKTMRELIAALKAITPGMTPQRSFGNDAAPHFGAGNKPKGRSIPHGKSNDDTLKDIAKAIELAVEIAKYIPK